MVGLQDRAIESDVEDAMIRLRWRGRQLAAAGHRGIAKMQAEKQADIGRALRCAEQGSASRRG
jgi:hypothetical protein